MNSLTINSSIIWLVAISALLWGLIKVWLLPLLARNMLSEGGEGLPNAWGKLALWGVLRNVFGMIALAGGGIIIFFKSLDMWLSSQNKTEGNLETIVSFRNNIEGVLDSLQVTSVTVWGGALVVIALIWGLASRSGSRKRWLSALDARKSAIKVSLEDHSSEKLRSRLGEIPDSLEKFDTQVLALTESNSKQIDLCFDLPVFEVGDDGETLSVNMLEELISNSADDDLPQELKNNIQEKILDFTKTFSVDLENLSGSSKSYYLHEARAHVSPSDEEVRSHMIDLIVRNEVDNHRVQADSISEKEPEIIKEWIGSALTSETVVSLTSKWGRLGAYMALILVVLGFIGFSTLKIAPNLVESAQAVELSIISGQSSVTQKAISSTESEDESDINAQQYLRSYFRASAIHNLTGANRKNPSAAHVRRMLQQVTAAEVKRNILLKSTRPVAASLDIGAPKQVYEVTHSLPGSNAVKDVEKIFDDAMTSRINELKNNRPVWDQVKKAAAQSSSTKYASSAFFNTLLIPDDIANSHALKAYANQAADDFTRVILESKGAVPTNVVNFTINESTSRLTNRDRRIIAGFRTEVPNYLEAVVSSYDSGRANPGSLSRSIPRSSAGVNTAAIRSAAASQYDNLFPAVAQSIGESFGGAANNSSSSSPTGASRAKSARSFGKIRFSGRVGGVVIGIESKEQEHNLNVIDFFWTQNREGILSLTLQTADGQSVNLGEFKSAIVHHALAYAADGRVVTATLPQPVNRSEGEDEFFINDRRVVVHPAFEDTSFACFAIQVDRFVDGYMFDDPNLKEVRAAVTHLGAILNDMARLGGLRPVIGMSSEELKNQFSSSPKDIEMLDAINNILEEINYRSLVVEAYVKKCDQLSECFPIATYASQGFNFTGVSEWLSCLSSFNVSNCNKKLASVDGGTSYLVDSGVRESKYRLDGEFNFLKLDKHREDVLWPLDFIVQAVPQTAEGADVEVKEDADPWSFPLISEKIKDVVINGLKGEKNGQLVLANMKEFVILQRFFRLGLNGTFGAGFPIYKLVDLQENTRQFVNVSKHEKWNYGSGFNRLLGKESVYFHTELQKINEDTSLGKACKSQISIALNNYNETLASTLDIWKFIGGLESYCDISKSLFADLVSRRNSLRDRELVDEFIYYLTLNRSENNQRFFCPGL